MQAQAGLLPFAEHPGAADKALLLRQVQQAEAEQPPEGELRAEPISAIHCFAAQQHQEPDLRVGGRGQSFGRHKLRALHCRLQEPHQPPLVQLQRFCSQRDPHEQHLRKRSTLPALLRQKSMIAHSFIVTYATPPHFPPKITKNFQQDSPHLFLYTCTLPRFSPFLRP